MPDVPSQPSTEDIVEFLIDYVAAYGSGSLDALRPFYTDASLIWPNQRPVVRGWAEVRAMFTPSFEHFAIKASVYLLEVRNLGDERFLRFLTEVHLTPRVGGDAIVAAFRDFAVLRRSRTHWTILRNIDQPITLEQLREDLTRGPPLAVIGPHAEEGGK